MKPLTFTANIKGLHGAEHERTFMKFAKQAHDPFIVYWGFVQTKTKETFLNRCHHLNNVKTDLNLNSSFRDEKYHCFTLKYSDLTFAKLCLFNVISISNTLYGFYSFEPTGI